MYLQSFCFRVLGSINTMIMMIKITNTIPPTTNLILDFEDDNFDEPLNGTFPSSTCIRLVSKSLNATLVFFSFSSKKVKEMMINIMNDKGFQNICLLSLYVQNFQSNTTTLVRAKFEMGHSF